MKRDRLLLWIQACRPKTLAASISPVIVGTLLSLKLQKYSTVIFIIALLTALAIQIGVNLANDYFDFIKGTDTPNRKGPTRMSHVFIPLPSMKKATWIVFILGLLIGCCGAAYPFVVWGGLKGSLVLGGILIASVLLGFGYTTGPFPLSYIGLGEPFALLFFGPIATVSTFYLHTMTIAWPPFILGLVPGLLSTALLAINNLRDLEEDRTAQKHTLAVRFGELFGKVEYTGCVLIAFCLPLIYGYYLLALFASLCALSPIIKTWTNQDKRKLNQVLEETGKLMLLFCVLLALSVFGIL